MQMQMQMYVEGLFCKRYPVSATPVYRLKLGDNESLSSEHAPKINDCNVQTHYADLVPVPDLVWGLDIGIASSRDTALRYILAVGSADNFYRRPSGDLKFPEALSPVCKPAPDTKARKMRG